VPDTAVPVDVDTLERCAICAEDHVKSTMFRLNCLHYFCVTSIVAWFRVSCGAGHLLSMCTCPMCRSPVNQEVFTLLHEEYRRSERHRVRSVPPVSSEEELQISRRVASLTLEQAQVRRTRYLARLAEVQV